MKITIRLQTIGFLLILFTTVSCSKSDKPIGQWDDIIKLSQKEVRFSSEKDSITISTEGKWWWIDEIALNGNPNFDLSGIDVASDNYSINETEFKIERRSATEIYIEMTKNQTGSPRVLVVGLEAGDYFDGIKITQSAN